MMRVLEPQELGDMLRQRFFLEKRPPMSPVHGEVDRAWNSIIFDSWFAYKWAQKKRFKSNRNTWMDGFVI